MQREPAYDLTTETVPLTDLRPHPDNARVGDVGAIKESLETNSQYRPIVVTTDGTILAGNHTYKAALALGWETIAVTRLDLEPGSAEARRIMLADNRTAELGGYDNAALLSLLEGVDSDLGSIVGTGFDTETLQQLKDLVEGIIVDPAPAPEWEKYTNAINVPQYLPNDRKPPVGELYDPARTDRLLLAIDEAEDLPADIRDFLRAAAYRHTVINYRKVADFYANSDESIQRLIADSALIIIDPADAIAKGYAKLSDWLTTQEVKPDED